MKALQLELPISRTVIGDSAMQFIEESQHSDLNEYRLFAALHCVHVSVCMHILTYYFSGLQININIELIFYFPMPKILSQV